MDLATLNRLCKLNQLSLTDCEKEKLMGFFDKAEADYGILNAKNTENTERMVHVMPLTTVVREDVSKKLFTRDELQSQAPEATDGYWQVPRLVE